MVPRPLLQRASARVRTWGLGASRGLGFSRLVPLPRSESKAQQDELEEWQQELVERLEEVQLRVTSLSTVLRCFGRALRERPNGLASDEAETLFSHSRDAEKLDYFLSHSWQSSGIAKYFTLLLFLYRGHAMVVGFTAGAALLAFQSFVYRFPARCVHDNFIGFTYCPSWIELVVGFAVTWVVMLLGGFWSPGTIFLDSVCVHQSDAARKAEGIWNIPSTVRLSEHMIVAFDDEYFQRGWCIYELAVKVSTTPKSELTSRVHFLSLTAYSTVAALHFFWQTGAVLYFLIYPKLIQVTGFAMTLSLASGLVPALGEAYASRKLETEKQSLARPLTEFKVQSAKFSMDSDRSAILERIKTMFGDLDAFNKVVRTDVREAAMESFSQQPASLPYSLVSFCNFPLVSFSLTQCRSFALASFPTRVASCFESIVWPLCIAPLATALSMYVGKSAPACTALITGCVSMLFLELATHAVYTIPLLISERKLFFLNWNPWLGTVAVAIVGAALAGVTLAIYLPRRLPPSQETDDTDGVALD